jgi:hypothetical protein
VEAQIVSTGKSVEMTIDTAQSGKNIDLDAWKNHPLVIEFRKTINKADRLIKLHEDTKELQTAVERLKKGLVLKWDYEILISLRRDLQDKIDELED